MGVNYSHYLIPQDNTVRPQPGQIIALIEAWTEKGFIVPANRRTSQATARFLTPPLADEPVAQEQSTEPRQGFWARLSGKPTAKPSPRPDPWKPFSVSPTGESLSVLANRYTLIRWEGDSQAVYPMKTVTGDQSFSPYLMIELSDDFLNIETDSYGSSEGDVSQVDPICTCGCDLGYDEDQIGCSTTQRIRRLCPSCGAAFRPQDHFAEIADGATGEKTPQPGGLCNRFAIIIEFGKEMPLYTTDADGELIDCKAGVTDAFLETCVSALGIKLNEFSHYS